MDISTNTDQAQQKHQQKSPILTVDIIIRYKGGIVLVNRKYPPKDWALPGGHVDYGETVEYAAIREAKEETNLDVELVKQFHVYSDPKRSPKEHKVTVVFIANGKGELKAGDDADDANVFGEGDILKLPKLCSDHNQILLDYYNDRYNGHYDDE
ncbi:NUDIX hydrolase [Candidatus Woesearchaeota archaeon]|nr:NUDIX hydrolase [Candidatus Woesearchaeota archaeon]